jgi:tetratricopeptide (TPR) repeat protein
MKKNFILFLFLSCFLSLIVKSSDVDLYYNAGIEKYLQGDYITAVDNFEKAINIDPDNTQIKNLLKKVIIEAGTHYNLIHKYSEAMTFLEKGKNYFPDDEKINELYNVTKEIITPTEQKTTKEKKATKDEIIIKNHKQEFRQEDKPKIENIKPDIKKEQTQKQKLLETSNLKSNDNIVQNEYYTKLLFLKYLIYFMTSVVSILVIILIYLIIIHKKQISELKSVLENKEKIESELRNELTLQKHKSDLEKELTYKLQSELKMLKLEFENIVHNDYEKKLKNFVKKGKIDLDSLKSEIEKEHIEKQKRKIELLTTDTATKKQENDIFISDPKIEQIRERISIMLQNTYEESPQIALEIIKKLSEDSDSNVRSNIIRSLIKIATNDTLDILFKLYNDNDEQVKREVIKGLNILSEQIRKKELIIDENYKNMIEKLIDEEYRKGEWIF